LKLLHEVSKDAKVYVKAQSNSENFEPSKYKTIVEEPKASKAYDKLDKNQQKSIEDALRLIRNGEAGRNQHDLQKDLKGFKAIDIKGSGGGRGKLRMVFKETDSEIIIQDIIDYH
jgi:mRNA-degrading endonuclease RelE of RelBE toxin-antitoxin system